MVQDVISSLLRPSLTASNTGVAKTRSFSINTRVSGVSVSVPQPRRGASSYVSSASISSVSIDQRALSYVSTGHTHAASPARFRQVDVIKG